MFAKSGLKIKYYPNSKHKLKYKNGVKRLKMQYKLN